MPNPFINSYRITKDLEEKAKEAKQKKEKLDSLIPVYDKKIESLKKFGVEIKELLKKMDEIKSLYNEKSYLKAYDELDNLMKTVDSIVNDILSKKLESLKGDIGKLKGTGFSSDIGKKLNEITDIDVLENIEKSLRDEIISWTEKFISSMPGDLKNEIMKNYSEKLKSIKDLDLRTLIEFLRTINEDRITMINTNINRESDRLSYLKDIASRLKLNTDDLKEKEDLFYDLVKAEKLDDALKAINEINSEYVKRIEKIIKDALKVTEDDIADLRSYGVDVSKHSKTLKEIEKAKNDGNYSNVLDLLKITLSELENAKIRKIGEIIEKAKDEIQKAKAEGFDIKVLLTYIDEARKNLISKNFRDALKNVSLVNETIEKMRNKKEELIKEIEKLKADFSGLVDTWDLDKITALARTDPGRAESELNNFKNSMEKSVNKKVEDLKRKLRAMVEILENNGANIDKIKSYFEYDDIKFLRSLDEIKANIERSLMDWFNEKINTLRLMGVNPDSLNKYLQDVLKHLNEFNLEAMNESLKILGEEIKMKEKEIKQKKIDLMKNMIEKLSGIEDFSFLKKFYSNTEDLEKYGEKDLAWLITQYIDLQQNFPIEASKFFAQKNLKNLSGRIEVMLNDIKSSIRSLDYAGAINIVKDLNSKSKNNFSKFLLVSAGQNYIIKHFPYDETKKYLEDISDQVSEGEIDLAFLNLKTVRENVEKHVMESSFSEFKELRDIAFKISRALGLGEVEKFEVKNGSVSAIEPVYLEILKNVKEMKLRVFVKLVDLKRKIDEYRLKSLEMDYGQAINSYRSGDIEKSWNIMAEIERKIESFKGEYSEILKKVNELKKTITYFENLRIDLPESKNILENLNRLVSQGNFEELNDYYRSSYLKVKAEIYSKVGQFIDAVEKEVLAQKGKRNTLVAEGLIASAKRVIKLDNALEATKYAFQALQEIESFTLLKSIVDSLVVKVKEIITNIGTVDQNLIRSFENIQRNIMQRKYAQEIMDLNNIIEKYSELSELLKSIKEKINQVKEKLTITVQFGIKVQDMLALYQNARNAFQSGKNEMALKLLDEALSKLDIEIERIFINIEEDLGYLSKLSGYMKLDYDTTNMKNSIFSRNLGELKNISEEMKKITDTVYERLKFKMEEIYSLTNGETMEKDLDVIYNLWKRKNYPAILDSMKLIESRSFLNYYDSTFLFFSKILNDTVKIIDFHSYIYGEMESLYQISMDFGTKNFKEKIENEYNQVKNKAIENLNQMIKSIENEYLSMNYEKSHVDLYALLNNGEFFDLFNSILRERLQIKRIKEIIEKNKDTINQIGEKLELLEKYGVDVSKERKELKRILEENVLTVDLNSLKNILEELNKNVSELDANITMNLTLTIGNENIPFKAKIMNNGVPVKDSSLKISGVVEDKTFETGSIEKEIELSGDLKKKEDRGKIKFIITYTTMPGSRREKSAEMDLVTIIEHGFKKTKASGTEKCSLCRGKIFKDLDMVICEKCGATYHYQCAQRAKKCLNCGNVFDFSETKTVQEELRL